jgi:hypothetical protein
LFKGAYLPPVLTEYCFCCIITTSKLFAINKSIFLFP